MAYEGVKNKFIFVVEYYEILKRMPRVEHNPM